MKKTNKKAFPFWILFAVFVISVIIGFVFFFIKIKDNPNFYSVSITDYLGVILDLIVGVFLAIVIFYVTNQQTTVNSRKEIAHEALNKIQSTLDNARRPSLSCDLKEYWNYNLKIKTHLTKYIASLSSMNKMSVSFIDTCALFKVHLNEYYNFYCNNFYSKAMVTEAMLETEQELFEKLLDDIIDALCNLY